MLHMILVHKVFLEGQTRGLSKVKFPEQLYNYEGQAQN